MEELEKNTIEIINQINQDWVDAVREAKIQKTYPSSTEMMGRFSESMKTLLQHFREAKQRLSAKKGRWF